MPPPAILLVEDNFDDRAIYRLILEHSGYVVLEASDGEEGIRLAREMQPHVILMDISIPKVDGLEATRILKADARTRRIPIIALTAHVLNEERAKGAVAGFDAYLAKPVEPLDVVKEVERWITPKGAEHRDDALDREA